MHRETTMNTKNLASLPDSTTHCLRCKAPMKDTGPVILLQGKAEVLGLSASKHDPLELTAEVCPKCGKVEFFI